VEVLYERVAGLDIGKATLTVCVRTPGPRGGRRVETRTFSAMTRSLQVMRDWLVECGVTVAAMESTSTYAIAKPCLQLWQRTRRWYGWRRRGRRSRARDLHHNDLRRRRRGRWSARALHVGEHCDDDGGPRGQVR
jgi:hypothetical protein